MLFRLFFVMLMLLTAVACQPSGNKNKTVLTAESARQDSLVQAYVAARDSANVVWNTMEKQEEDMFFNMRRLLDEIRYTDNYNEAELDSLYKLVETLKNYRFTQESIKNDRVIDRYDSATQATTDAVLLFAETHPQFNDYPLMGQLVDEILEARNQVLFRRIRYDEQTIMQNELLEEHERLSGIDSLDARKKPLFQISAE